MAALPVSGAVGLSRFLPLLAGAIFLFLANRYALLLLLSFGLTWLSATFITLLLLYGLLFLICDSLEAGAKFRRASYFFFRGACLGALYMAPHIAALAAPPTASFDFTTLTIMVGAILIFIGHVLTRIMFSAADEREFFH